MKYLPLAFGMLILFSGLASAGGGLTYNPPSCNGNNDLLNTLTNLPGCIVQDFFSYIINGLISAIRGLIQASFTFLFSSPDLTWFCGAYQTVMSLLESLYAIALMGIALVFIVRANEVEWRIQAKYWLEKLIILMVLLAFSFGIFQLILNFNTYLASSFANQSMLNTFNPNGNLTSAVFAFLILLLTVVMILLVFITLLARYILIPFLLLLFPIALFLYFLPVGQDWGKTLLKGIGLIIFIPAADALILLGLNTLFNANDPNLSSALVQAFAMLIGFGLMGVINALLMLSAVTSVVNQAGNLPSIPGANVLGNLIKK